MSGEKVRDLRVAYIGGGSRGWAWGFMTDLAMDGQLCGVVRLYDIDREAAQNNRVIGEKISAHPDALSPWRYEVAQTLEEALSGADFVVISILPGTFEEMRSDVHTPEKYGIYQSVGDTVGAGGIVRAMRTIPMYVEIAQAIRDHAPRAWVMNYTNPMSVCVRTLYRVFPGIKAFGCCHEVFGTQKLLAAMVRENLGVEDCERQDIKTTVTGVNHFTWIQSASYRQTDLFQMYAAFADKYFESGYLDARDDHGMNGYFACAHRVKFDLFRRYGLIAAAGDRHLAEFTPDTYLRSPECAQAWGFRLTPVSWRVEDLHRRLSRQRALLSGAEKPELKASGEEGHLLLKALLGLGDRISNVNLPNQGQIANLPLGAVVETNALFRRDEIRPVLAGPLPSAVHALVARHCGNQEATVEAALTQNRALLEATFKNDPQMAGLDADAARRLLSEMLDNTRAYLPAWLRKA